MSAKDYDPWYESDYGDYRISNSNIKAVAYYPESNHVEVWYR